MNLPGKNHFGILNVAKPPEISSRRVVDEVVRLVRPAKAGHAGTLDPMATGVLVVCVGKATRLIELIQAQPKSYRAQFLLGRESDTDDVTGNVSEVSGHREITRAEMEAVLPSFLGRIEQRPPTFSAVHVEGVRAYKLARRGIAVEPAPRGVEVHRLELTGFTFPEFELAIDCGSGTYVRSIGRDIGRALGCGAVMSSLVRTRIGRYALDDAVPLADLNAENLDRMLLSPSTAVEAFPQFRATPEDIVRIGAGRPLNGDFPDGQVEGSTVAILDGEGNLLCLAEFDAQTQQLLPRRVFIESCR